MVSTYIPLSWRKKRKCFYLASSPGTSIFSCISLANICGKISTSCALRCHHLLPCKPLSQNLQSPLKLGGHPWLASFAFLPLLSLTPLSIPSLSECVCPFLSLICHPSTFFFLWLSFCLTTPSDCEQSPGTITLTEGIYRASVSRAGRLSHPHNKLTSRCSVKPSWILRLVKPSWILRLMAQYHRTHTCMAPNTWANVTSLPP